ncbi:MAG: hypothetical protein P8O18_00840, partial [Candidatus Thioglobus sp.]|nr:hypothetical protein [Candidatus Thioglobus sp.]
MLDITRKKYSGEMKFTVTRAFTHKTVAELREELLRVKSIVDYWEDKSNKRAFGEIKTGNISFEKWREIYASFGWIELEEYRCFYNPKSVSIDEDMITSLPSIEGNSDNEQSGTWASY